MVRSDAVSNFPCLRKKKTIHPIKLYLGHKSHSKCIVKYMKSENGKQAVARGHLCPMRCSEPG